jgi:hypothetical protein
MIYVLVAAAWSWVVYLGYSDWKSNPEVIVPANKIIVGA